MAQQAQQGRPGSRLPLEEVLRSLRTPADADGAQRPPLPYAGGPAMPLEEAASPGGADEGWFAEQVGSCFPFFLICVAACWNAPAWQGEGTDTAAEPWWHQRLGLLSSPRFCV